MLAFGWEESAGGYVIEFSIVPIQCPYFYGKSSWSHLCYKFIHIKYASRACYWKSDDNVTSLDLQVSLMS